ncbi:MAG: flagellar export chaperone FliS [Nitrospirae bacterium]|nr:flagellar export chaperone FliS [Nitrospirota bacterium]
MQQLSEYRKAEVNTSDRVKIISMLYDGAINFIRVARKRMELGDIAGKGLYIGKASSVVGELMSSLDMEAGGNISKNLSRLYDFVQDRLITANMKNDERSLNEAEKVLDLLRSAWKELGRDNTVDIPKEAISAGMDLRV